MKNMHARKQRKIHSLWNKVLGNFLLCQESHDVLLSLFTSSLKQSLFQRHGQVPNQSQDAHTWWPVSTFSHRGSFSVSHSIQVFTYFSVQQHRNKHHNTKGRIQNVMDILEAGPRTWDMVRNQSSLLGSHGLHTEFELPSSDALQVPDSLWCPISGIKAV